jgi:hypothetical protein
VRRATRVGRALARCVTALACAGACAALLAAWVAPGTMLALWGLASFCR